MYPQPRPPTQCYECGQHIDGAMVDQFGGCDCHAWSWCQTCDIPWHDTRLCECQLPTPWDPRDGTRCDGCGTRIDRALVDQFDSGCGCGEQDEDRHWQWCDECEDAWCEAQPCMCQLWARQRPLMLPPPPPPPPPPTMPPPAPSTDGPLDAALVPYQPPPGPRSLGSRSDEPGPAIDGVSLQCALQVDGLGGSAALHTDTRPTGPCRDPRRQEGVRPLPRLPSLAEEDLLPLPPPPPPPPLPPPHPPPQRLPPPPPTLHVQAEEFLSQFDDRMQEMVHETRGTAKCSAPDPKSGSSARKMKAASQQQIEWEVGGQGMMSMEELTSGASSFKGQGKRKAPASGNTERRRSRAQSITRVVRACIFSFEEKTE